MTRTLRARLIFSQILPLVIVVPVLFFAFSYLIETRFLVPRLAQELLTNARLLAEIVRVDYSTTGDQRSLQLYLLELQPNPQVRLVYLKPDGEVIFSNDPAFIDYTGKKITTNGLQQAQGGDPIVLTRRTAPLGGKYSIEVLLPVKISSTQYVGILWLTYIETSLARLFQEMRWLAVIVTAASILIGGLIGSVLAFQIGRPVSKATHAIRNLARGQQNEVLEEQGPNEMRELVREVNILVTRLHSLEQARSQLLANLVHELGRPLGALRSAIQALQRGASEDPVLFQDLTIGMDEEAARLQNILNDLTHLHGQILGPMELKLEKVQLNEWLPRALISWQESAAEKKLSWRLNVPDELPMVQIDQVRFAQVVGNLASNAIKFTPAGGQIDIRAGEENGEVWITFKDNGIGISQEEQKSVFQPFYQGTHAQRIKKGMGLGLSISRDLVSAHNGRITLRSAPGEGSSFTVWLPNSSKD